MQKIAAAFGLALLTAGCIPPPHTVCIEGVLYLRSNRDVYTVVVFPDGKPRTCSPNTETYAK